MLRVDERFEISSAALGEEDPRVRRFHWAQQCLDVPLWYVEVLSRPAPEDGSQFWSRYIATRTIDVVFIAGDVEWESTNLHVVLPARMTNRDSPVFARCLAIWECSVRAQEFCPAWLFETDHGMFVDPLGGHKLQEVKKQNLRWQKAPAR
jgi:hypothetical protein